MGDGGAAAATVESGARRLAGIDVLRGFVMLLMSIDHASEAFNAGRVFTDSAYFWKPGTPLPEAQFLTRWMTHLCAPTFVFLAGMSLAMSVGSRAARGARPVDIDRHILTRGLLLVLFEVAWMSWVMLGPGRVLFQVLYAIGASLVLMIPLRRLGDAALGALALALVFGVELLIAALGGPSRSGSIPAGLLWSGGFYFDARFIVAYPVLPWLAMMCLGWVLGRRILVWRSRGEDEQRAASRTLFVGGLACAATFVVLRGNNGFGNLFLAREGGGIVEWLHVSKYPPSVTFTTLELGIAALLLAALLRLGERAPRALEPLRRVGQVALFYYLLHIHALKLVAWISGWHERLGLGAAYVGGVAVFAALYPLCVVYGRYKRAHPTGIAQYI